MPLTADEIEPGIVAILEAATLSDDSRVQHEDLGANFRSGPFLCVDVKGEVSRWLAITTKAGPRGLRLSLSEAWRVDGSEVWHTEPQWINDARKPFIGPNESFVDAAAKELPHRPHNRPRVSLEGLEAVRAEVLKYRAPSL